MSLDAPSWQRLFLMSTFVLPISNGQWNNNISEQVLWQWHGLLDICIIETVPN